MIRESDHKTFFLPDFCHAQNTLFLVLGTELLVFVLVLFDTESLYVDWASIGLSSLFAQSLALSAATLLCNFRGRLINLSAWKATAVVYSLILTLAFLYSFIAEMFLYDYKMTIEGWGRLARNLIISTIVSGVCFRYFYLSHQLRLQEQAELKSRIQALQSRIRPHFLFNSMNIIASLIPLNPELAERVVEDLSLLFRASLEKASDEPVSLEEELDLCRKYLNIEGLRLDDRLDVEFQLEANVSVLKIPLLTIQPLLENSIYHGIQPLPEGGKVSLNIKTVNEQIIITITNPLSADRTNQKVGNKLALVNIRNRMTAIFGPGVSLTTEAREGRYITKLTYPEVY